MVTINGGENSATNTVILEFVVADAVPDTKLYRSPSEA